ncbi:MAG: glycoside hydrolase family 26 protein [Actinopolymorphaceae bacterium]
MGHLRGKVTTAVVVGILAATVACQQPATKRPTRSPPTTTVSVDSTCGIEDKLVPTCGAWWGVAANPFDGESWHEALTDYERQIDRTVNIAHFYHRAGDLFPTSQEVALADEPGKERLLLINYKPQAGHSWAEVARGATNDELDRLAAHIKRTFDRPFFFVVHHEPENDVDPRPGSGYTAADYRAMYRHVVTRLESRGASKLVRVMNYIGLPAWGVQPWYPDLYPGDDVVDWIAYDPYVFGTGQYWGGVEDLIDRRFDKHRPNDRYWATHPEWPGFYTWATRFAPEKSLMLAEWGIAEKPGSPRAKAEFFTKLGHEAAHWPRVKAFVYWNSPSDRTVGETRIDSSTAALRAYRDIGLRGHFNP